MFQVLLIDYRSRARQHKTDQFVLMCCARRRTGSGFYGWMRRRDVYNKLRDNNEY